MSRKTQHTRFEDKILGKLANEDKPQVVTPWRGSECDNDILTNVCPDVFLGGTCSLQCTVLRTEWKVGLVNTAAAAATDLVAH